MKEKDYKGFWLSLLGGLCIGASYVVYRNWGFILLIFGIHLTIWSYKE